MPLDIFIEQYLDGGEIVESKTSLRRVQHFAKNVVRTLYNEGYTEYKGLEKSQKFTEKGNLALMYISQKFKHVTVVLGEDISGSVKVIASTGEFTDPFGDLVGITILAKEAMMLLKMHQDKLLMALEPKPVIKGEIDLTGAKQKEKEKKVAENPPTGTMR